MSSEIDQSVASRGIVGAPVLDVQDRRPNAVRASAPGVDLYRPPRLNLSVEHVLRVQGYNDPARVRPAIRAAAESAAALVRQSSTPAVWSRRVAVTGLADDRLSLDGGVTLTSPAFAKYLAGCTEAVAFVLTLGGAFDTIRQNMNADRLLEMVLMDAAGWMAIEEATQAFTRHIGGKAQADGMQTTRRLAPGYAFRIGDAKVEWKLEDQEQLFTLFAGVDLPVRLLESCAMLPRMSRSGLFGLRPAAPLDAIETRNPEVSS